MRKKLEKGKITQKKTGLRKVENKIENSLSFETPISRITIVICWKKNTFQSIFVNENQFI